MPEALVVIDFQNDFTPGGALGVDGGDEIAERINQLAADDRFDLVVATRDWHPPDHGSFTDQGGIWPVHCVQGTPGAELFAGLDRANVDLILDKGQPVDTDGYSAFDGTRFDELLRERGIDRLTFVGLATDYCVKNSVLDARELGFEVEVDTDAIRAVDREPGDGDRAIEAMRAAGATVSSARPSPRT
jgi:nicotinamidase-related amidase